MVKIHCEVLEVSAPKRLRYSWTSAAKAPGASGLDTTVIWTLERVEGGTLLRLVHDGFRPGNEHVTQMMHEGWQEKIPRSAASQPCSPESSGRKWAAALSSHSWLRQRMAA